MFHNKTMSMLRIFSAALLCAALVTPPTHASISEAQAKALEAKSKTVVQDYLKQSAASLARAHRQSIEAFGRWVQANGSQPYSATLLNSVLSGVGNSTDSIITSPGSFMDMLRQRLSTGYKAQQGGSVSSAAQFAERHRAAAQAAAGNLATLADQFIQANTSLIRVVQDEYILDGLDQGLVPQFQGSTAQGLLRDVGVPIPNGTDVASFAENLVQYWIGMVLRASGTPANINIKSRAAAVKALYSDLNRHCPIEKLLPAAEVSTECQAWTGSTLLASGPAAPDVPTRPGDDPFNEVFEMELGGASPTPVRIGTLRASSITDLGPRQSKPPAAAARVANKIHPELKKMIDRQSGDSRVEVIVNLRDNIQIPRFPEREAPRAIASWKPILPNWVGAGVSSSSAPYLVESQKVIRAIQQQRAADYDNLITSWTGKYGIKSMGTFWLIRALHIEAPLSAMVRLSNEEDVLSIEPVQTEEKPPQDANNKNDIEDGRARIKSDPYFNLKLKGSDIALLDTGVRFPHNHFKSPDHILLEFDCTDGTCDGSPNPSDNNWNHGTSSASIIVGNQRLGNQYRAVTELWLSSYKIYTATGLNTVATIKGFQEALRVNDTILVAEIQSTQSPTGSISAAADAAFDAGAVVIAANGNYGPAASSVASPGNAHKALGIGNYVVDTLAAVNSQGRGPTPDNRIKPDLQFPTNTEAASNASNTALQVFTGTSGATPYAAGVAALVRNWLKGKSRSIDPGKVYAFMMLGGQQTYPFNNTTGAGKFEMPLGGKATWGKVSVHNGKTIEISITVGANQKQIDAALWWPETAAQQHNDIDLSIVDPSGTTRTTSLSGPSVFERARFKGNLAKGTWKIKIRGFNVRTGSQTVYWAEHHNP